MAPPAVIRLALLLGILVGLAILLRRRRIPTPAEITAMDEPTFARFLDRIGMTRRVKAALRADSGHWVDEGGGWER